VRLDELFWLEVIGQRVAVFGLAVALRLHNSATKHRLSMCRERTSALVPSGIWLELMMA
jgi:hypothetical protein